MSQTPIRLVLLLIPFLWQAALADDDTRFALLSEMEYLLGAGSLSNRPTEIAAKELIANVYENRDYRPNWVRPGQVEELLAMINASTAEGLDPADYHVGDVQEYRDRHDRDGPMSSADLAVRDIILTDSLIRLGYHQLFGKVNPYELDPNWNFRRNLGTLEPAVAIQAAIDAPSLQENIRQAVPRGWYYDYLMTGLARYQAIANEGGWPLIAAGATLRPGERDDRVPAIAQRLHVSGDLQSLESRATGTHYDDSLEQAVRQFQSRHALDVDGIIGSGTLAEMNVPVEQRIQQLRINLERARWLQDDLDESFVIVNIAGFEAHLVRNKKFIWQTDVQVGRSYRQSPVFRDEIKYLVFNPTWTVPYSIATRSLLPAIQKDPGYLARNGFDVKGRNGALVDPDDVDWASHSRGNFPYTLVQNPGPANAMGQVKFMFPNEHAVYLHDTPSKALFARADRAFSNGCIRVRNPVELAEHLLGDDWDEQRIQQTLDGGKLTNVMLPAPLPIYLVYLTAGVDEDNHVYFYRDVYDRDAKIGEALAMPFKLDIPEA